MSIRVHGQYENAYKLQLCAYTHKIVLIETM